MPLASDLGGRPILEQCVITELGEVETSQRAESAALVLGLRVAARLCFKPCG